MADYFGEVTTPPTESLYNSMTTDQQLSDVLVVPSDQASIIDVAIYAAVASGTGHCIGIIWNHSTRAHIAHTTAVEITTTHQWVVMTFSPVVVLTASSTYNFGLALSMAGATQFEYNYRDSGVGTASRGTNIAGIYADPTKSFETYTDSAYVKFRIQYNKAASAITKIEDAKNIGITEAWIRRGYMVKIES